MNKVDLLKARKLKLFSASSDVRKKIEQVIDESSFVELDIYAFAKNDFLGENVDGLGVVTGYATIDDNPVYVVAQNAKILNGGISKANCEKIVRCMTKALQDDMPIVYILESQGVQVGEGVGVLEGLGNVLGVMTALKGSVPQFAIVTGDLFGTAALIAANADYTFVTKDGCISYASPAVIAATSKTPVTKECIGGAKAVNGVGTFFVKDIDEAKLNISKIMTTVPAFGGDIVDCDDDMNRSTPALNNGADAKAVIEATFDKGSFVEMNSAFASEVKVGIGRVGGISTAGVVFDGGKEGVELTLDNVLKVKNFINYANENSLPVVLFLNTKGISTGISVAKSFVMTEVVNLMIAISNASIVSVVYKKAIGLAYSLFASKGMGIQYTYAFADAKISLLDGEAGVAAEFGVISEDKLDELKEKYADEAQDALSAAEIGCIDNIIEPEFVRQYVISALQLLVR